jgi:hypothetical protein
VGRRTKKETEKLKKMDAIKKKREEEENTLFLPDQQLFRSLNYI